jgi:PIN domain nuclease of toxin-antitoxin system
MPIVPTYQERQVRTQALQPVLQQTLDVSSGARALAQGLGQVAEAADRRDLRDAQAKASTAEATITSEWLKWDSANRNKYRGANADGYAPAAEAWWQSAAENAGKDLDPRAKALASQNLRAKQMAAMGNVLTFTGAEKERHADETYAADVNTTIQFGVTSGDVASTAAQIREKAAVLGARKGWTTEQVQAEAGKNLSSMHLAQITKLAETNAEAAQAYYDANKAEVAFQNQARVEQVLKGELDNQFATQTAASMADKPLKEQLAEAAKITDPQRREKTLMQVRNNHALVKQAKAEQEAQFSDQAWQLFSRGQKIPEAVLSGMNGRERAQLQESMRARSERMAQGTPVKTDTVTYIDLREKLARGEKVDLRAYTEKIGKTEMETLLDIQTTASKGGVKQDSMLTDEGRINNALLGLGIDKKKNDQQANAAKAIVDEIDRRVRAASAAKGGKDLTADEKQGIVDRVVLDKVYVDEWGTDPQKPLALLTPEEVSKAYVRVDGRNVPVSSVPMTDRRQIVKALQATGQIATEQAIVEMYLAGQKKGPAK